MPRACFLEYVRGALPSGSQVYSAEVETSSLDLQADVSGSHSPLVHSQCVAVNVW